MSEAEIELDALPGRPDSRGFDSFQDDVSISIDGIEPVASSTDAGGDTHAKKTEEKGEEEAFAAASLPSLPSASSSSTLLSVSASLENGNVGQSSDSQRRETEQRYAVTATAVSGDSPWKTFEQLYQGEKQEYARELRMSTGEDVDCVLMFKLPADPTMRAEVESVTRDEELAHTLSESWRQQSKSTLPKSGTLPSHLQHAVRRWCYERELSQTKAQTRIEEIKRILASRASRTQDDIDDDDDFEDEIDDATAAAIFNAPAGARIRLDAEEAKQFGLDTELQFLEHQVATRRVHLEHELATSLDRVFVKVHVPERALMAEAERAGMRIRLNTRRVAEIEKVERERTKLLSHTLATSQRNRPSTLFDFDKLIFSNAEPDEAHSYLARFSYESRHNFIEVDAEGNVLPLFTDAQRFYLASRILASTPYAPADNDDKPRMQLGYERLLYKGSYAACFPLHDSALDASYGVANPKRVELNSKWSCWAAWRGKPPHTKIREYFGERIGFYFLWLGFYTHWLILPALFGLVVFIFSFVVQVESNSSDIREFCNSTRKMCPICETCESWIMNEACDAYRYSYLVDNHLTIIYAIGISLWATTFLEMWKRKAARAAYNWGTHYLRQHEPQRPTFRGRQYVPCEITGLLKRVYPSSQRYRSYFVSLLTVAFMCVLVCLSVVSVIIFRPAVRGALFENAEGAMNNLSDLVTTFLASCLTLLLILVLNRVYVSIARKLTELENHETDSSYEHAHAIKVFLFQCTNNYASIFYVAFFKGRVDGRPGEEKKLFGYTQDKCPEYGCLLEVCILLAVIMVGRQSFLNFQELLLPQFYAKLNKRSADFAKPEKPIPWERDAVIAAYPSHALFNEYMEMVLQFGFVTLFAAAFPLGAFFALFNNIIEQRVDAIKIVRSFRRPFGLSASNIGVWQKILTAVTLASVITNAFVIAISTNYLPRLVYAASNGNLKGYIDAAYTYSVAKDCYYEDFRDEVNDDNSFFYQVMMARLAFVIAFEHFVFAVTSVIMWLIPDVPSDVAIKLRREEYRAMQAMDSIFVETKGDDDAEDEHAEDRASFSATSHLIHPTREAKKRLVRQKVSRSTPSRGASVNSELG